MLPTEANQTQIARIASKIISHHRHQSFAKMLLGFDFNDRECVAPADSGVA